MNRKLEYLLSLPKSLVFNLRVFPLSVALKCPVFISYRTRIVSNSGKIIIDCSKVSTGMIKIGFGSVDIFDRYRSRTMFKNKGVITFHGKANIGHGSKLSIGKAGHLEFGDEFKISAESQIVCEKRISFGSYCMLSWDILIMDSDLHEIHSAGDRRINHDREILIGDHVWIGARSFVKKGVTIARGVIIAGQSVVVKQLQNENSIYGGNPAVLLKEGVTWS